MVTDSVVICIKTEDLYEDIADDVEKWFDISNYIKDDNRPLSIGWNKKVIGLRWIRRKDYERICWT